MNPRDVENYFAGHFKLALVVMAMIVVTAISGFFMGLRQTRDFSDVTRENRALALDSGPQNETIVPRAVTYSELSTAGLQPNAGWKNTLENIAWREPSREALPAATEEERETVLAVRESRRAYDGAPPVVPHPVDQLSSASCLLCHGRESQPVIAGKTPPRISHAEYANCTQCHVPSTGPGQGVAHADLGLKATTTFEGAFPTLAGNRAYEGAPPTMPHRTLMREDCMSCHGPGRANAIRTSHPERQSCVQCHSPTAAFDQRAPDLRGIAKPVAFPFDPTPIPPPESPAIEEEAPPAPQAAPEPAATPETEAP
jgi:cytochrome c-type protein NapB